MVWVLRTLRWQLLGWRVRLDGGVLMAPAPAVDRFGHRYSVVADNSSWTVRPDAIAPIAVIVQFP